VVRLQFDHATGRLAPMAARDSAVILSIKDRTVRLRKVAQIQLCVLHTNTGWYNVTVDTTQIVVATGNEAKTTDPTSFLNSIHGPFAALLGGLSRGGASLVPSPPNRADFPSQLTDAAAVADHIQDHIAAVQALAVGDASIASVRDVARTALARMRDSTPEAAAREFRTSLRRTFNADTFHMSDQPCQPTDGRMLQFKAHVDTNLKALRVEGDSLARLLSTTADVDSVFRHFRDSLMWIRSKADSFVAATSQLGDSANATETLVTHISGACSLQASPVHAMSNGSAQRFLVRMTPWPVADIVAVATDTITPAAIIVLPPRPWVTPSFGLSLIVSPGARFPTYATRTDSATKATVIYQPTVADDRYSWGATVGLNWRALTPDDTSPLKFWIPEITVAQASGVTGFGIGPAISWSAVKVGVGLLWIQHPILQGHVVGDAVPNSGYLQTVNGYGTPRVYFSLSFFGVPGFKY
jgi:hypothetical protein